MVEPTENWLLATRLGEAVEAIAAAGDAEKEAVWLRMERLLEAADAGEDADLAVPVWDRDLEALQRILAAWRSGSRPYVEHDKAVLRRAFKAFKKRLKLMRLDDESTAGANPLSAGRESSILGVRAPEAYTDDVWAVLVAQGKLRDAGDGIYEVGTAG